MSYPRDQYKRDWSVGVSSRGYVFPDYNRPWFPGTGVASAFTADSSSFYQRYARGVPITGTLVKRPRKQKRRLPKKRRSESAKTEQPELIWVTAKRPQLDANGIPIPESEFHAKHYGVQRKKIRRPTPYDPPWRKRVPVDLKLQHGPRLPEGREQAHRLAERLRAISGPIISVDLTEATEQETADLADLLDAITN